MSRRARQRFDRRVILNPVAVAIESASKLSQRDRTELQRIISDAWKAYKRGEHCATHWLTLADALNIAESLSTLGICSDDESRAKIDAGQRVLADAVVRHRERGTWALRASEQAAMVDALEIADIQLEHCSLGEFSRAKERTEVRVRQARAGNAPAGAIVIEGAIG